VSTLRGIVRGIQQVIDILSTKMHELGMTTRQIDPGKIGTVLVGELGITSSLSPVILDGHLDTVFPVGTAQKRPFKIVGDKITGPGIFDMKSGLVIGLYAIQALKHFQLLKRPVKMIVKSCTSTPEHIRLLLKKLERGPMDLILKEQIPLKN